MQGTEKRLVVFDGSECRIVQYRNGRRDADDRITGEDAGRQARGVTEFWKWLGMALPGASGPPRGTYPSAAPGTAVVGMERIDGVECVKVQWRQESPGRDTTWWIAPDRGHLALRRDEVRYYPPGTGLAPGQYTLTRRRVTEVKDFGSGICLPVKVERTVAWVNADGSVARVLRRFEFTASDIKVNERVDPGKFDIARLPPGYEGESRAVIGCGYTCMLDLCALLDIEIKNEGGAALSLSLIGMYPTGLAAGMGAPEVIPPHVEATVEVAVDRTSSSRSTWAAVLRTNDLLRPTLWLSSSGPAISPPGAAS
jgi:hypothetical protein